MKTHLIGVGGAGMSALATALAKCGVETTGADRTLGTPNLARLERLGVKIFPDDGSGVDATVSKVVVSTAIEKTNPGLAKAAALGIPVVHRAKALADLLAGHVVKIRLRHKSHSPFLSGYGRKPSAGWYGRKPSAG